MPIVYKIRKLLLSSHLFLAPAVSEIRLVHTKS